MHAVKHGAQTTLEQFPKAQLTAVQEAFGIYSNSITHEAVQWSVQLSSDRPASWSERQRVSQPMLHRWESVQQTLWRRAASRLGAPAGFDWLFVASGRDSHHHPVLQDEQISEATREHTVLGRAVCFIQSLLPRRQAPFPPYNFRRSTLHWLQARFSPWGLAEAFERVIC